MARANQPKEITRETLMIDGVEYEIVIDFAGGHYSGYWQCESSEASGRTSRHCHSVDDAKAAVKANMATYLEIKRSHAK